MIDDDVYTNYYPDQTVYYLIFDIYADIWNGSSFETFTAANWLNYANPLPEVDSGYSGYAGYSGYSGYTGTYFNNFPNDIPYGVYYLVGYAQLSTEPATNDTRFSFGLINWGGTAEFTESFSLEIGTSAAPSIIAGILSTLPGQQFITGEEGVNSVPTVIVGESDTNSSLNVSTGITPVNPGQQFITGVK